MAVGKPYTRNTWNYWILGNNKHLLLLLLITYVGNIFLGNLHLEQIETKA